MKRTRPLAGALVGMLMLGASIVPANAAAPPQTTLEREPLCESHKALCVDTFDTLGESYVGHDEPSVLFRVRRLGLRQ